MPTFCRHGRRIDRCPICSRDSSDVSRLRRRSATVEPAERRPARRRSPRAAAGLEVRHVAQPADDGFRHPVVPGIKATAAAERLAGELAFAAARLEAMRSDPPGLIAELAAEPDVEEATWLAFQIAYLGPLEAEDPFAAIAAARTSWASGELPQLDGVSTGPRGAHDAGRGDATPDAYRAWARRAGGQAAAFTGDEGWTPQRRFARIYERLALPGLHRAARFELLVMLGATGRYELEADTLHLGGADPVTTAAKRVFSIGDARELERRAAELAEDAEVPIAALDLALENWGSGEPRVTAGFAGVEPDPAVHARAQAALGL